MTIAKTLALALLATGIAHSASADMRRDADIFTVEFVYDAAAPVEQIYADFRRTAKRACRKEANLPGWTLVYAAALEDCTEKLVTEAVEQTQLPELADYHEARHTER